MSITAQRINPLPYLLVFIGVCALGWLLTIGQLLEAEQMDRIPHILSSSQCRYPRSAQDLSSHLRLAFDGLERSDGGTYFHLAFVSFLACGQKVPEMWPESP